MNGDLRRQIHNQMNLRKTEDLLEIWQENDHVEWSDQAFEVIREILKERGAEIPAQNELIREHDEKETDEEDYAFSEEELAIIDDENSPVFYDPFEVLLLIKRLDRMLRVMIGFIIANSILNFPTSKGIAQSFLFVDQDSILMFIAGVLIASVSAVLSIIGVYIPLMVLSRILRILMEMEFKSRKGSQSNLLVE